MKKNITIEPLEKLRRFLPGKKFLPLVVYFLLVALMAGTLAWRSLYVDRTPATEEPALEAVTETPAGEALPGEPTIGEALPEEVAPVADDPVVEALSGAAPVEPLRWPVEGELVTGHHEIYRINNQVRLHAGVDIAVPAGTEVLAAWPGVVKEVRRDNRLGLVMEIEHGGGYYTLYGNLEETFFAQGEMVPSGAAIGSVGSSAVLDAAEGNFLHFALYKDGKAQDPVQMIAQK